MPNQYWYARNDHPLDESRGQESLDCDAAIDVGMFEAALLELLYEIGRLAGHLFYYAVLDPGKILFLGAQHYYRLLAKNPGTVPDHEFVGLASHD